MRVEENEAGFQGGAFSQGGGRSPGGGAFSGGGATRRLKAAAPPPFFRVVLLRAQEYGYEFVRVVVWGPKTRWCGWGNQKGARVVE